MFFSKNTIHKAFLHWWILLFIIFLLMVSLSKNDFYFNSHWQNRCPKQNLRISYPNWRRFISLQTGKNGYPRQNLKLPYPNEYLCYCTLEHENPSYPNMGLAPPQGGPACVPVEKIMTNFFGRKDIRSVWLRN